MLQVTGARVRFGDTVALDGIDLTVGSGEVMAVLGPSGCGKTTLLRVVAGLERPAAGTVSWDGKDVTGLPPHRRGFGLMFQDYALFPHKDVAGNVAFGLRMQRVEPAAAVRRVAEVLELVGLPGFGERRVGGLSGGEQQRVALARALAPAPRLLMLDEPLGSLDRALRERLMVELGELLATLEITALYVTHDQEEALAVGTRLAVMDRGRISQIGVPEEVWRRPANEFVARFLGFEVIVAAVVADGVAATPWGDLPIGDAVPPGAVRLVVPPGAVRLDPAGPVAGRVVARAFRGSQTLARIEPERGPPLGVWLPGPVAVGEMVHVSFDPAAIVPLPPA